MLALTLATKNDILPDYSKTTLIGIHVPCLLSCILISNLVVPLSVISNWEQQIQEHCAPGAIKYIVYHGLNRSFSSQELTKYDVVITTYQTVSGEHTDSASTQMGSSKKKKKIEKSLFGVQWKVNMHRVYLYKC